MNNSVFGKTKENVRNHRNIKLLTTDEKRSKLVSEPNYYTTKHFSKNLLAIEIKKTKVIMTKPVYLDISILNISKTLMYEFWYDCIEPKNGDRENLCYMDIDGFVIHIINKDFYEDIANDFEIWFDPFNSEYNDKRSLPVDNNKKVIGLFKDELRQKIMKETYALRPKAYTYLMDYDCERKKAKGTEKCVIKRKVMFENYIDSLFNNKTVLKIQQTFKSDHHNIYAENIKKIVLSSNDDKKLKTFGKTTTYPHRTNAFRVCEMNCLCL